MKVFVTKNIDLNTFHDNMTFVLENATWEKYIDEYFSLYKKYL